MNALAMILAGEAKGGSQKATWRVLRDVPGFVGSSDCRQRLTQAVDLKVVRTPR